MKGKAAFLAGILILAAGIILMTAHTGIKSEGIVMTGGVLFIVAGIINTVMFRDRENCSGSSKKSGAATAFGMISSVAAIVLGACMLIFREIFAGLIPLVFGVLISSGALFQLYMLIWGFRPARLPAWLYSIPTLLAAGAIYVFLQDARSDDPGIMLVTGIALTIFGLGCFIESFFIKKAFGYRQRTMQSQEIEDVGSQAIVSLDDDKR